MSCHDIGRGMDSVTKVVFKMYIDGEITKDVAFRLFRALQKGVHWCDGNEYEATKSISGVLCGRCLKVFKEDEDPIDVWDTVNDLYDKVSRDKDTDDKYVRKFEVLYKDVCEKAGKTFSGNDIPNEVWDEMVCDNICEECFAEILRKCGEIK